MHRMAYTSACAYVLVLVVYAKLPMLVLVLMCVPVLLVLWKKTKQVMQHVVRLVDMVLQLVGVTAITCMALPLMTIPMVRSLSSLHYLKKKYYPIF